MPMAMRAGSLQEVVVTGAKKVQQEQLGDLKLYRVPERTRWPAANPNKCA